MIISKVPQQTFVPLKILAKLVGNTNTPVEANLCHELRIGPLTFFAIG